MDMIVKLDSETYSKHVMFENRKKVIYVVVLRKIYEMLVAALLFQKEFCGDLENIGFGCNPNDPCVANRIKIWQETRSDIPCGQRHIKSCES